MVWKSGQSGNPKGRAPDRVSAALKEALKGDVKTSHEIVRGVMSGMWNKMPVDARTALRAAQMIQDRYYGKAVSVIELSGPDGEPIRAEVENLQKLGLEDLEKLADILGRASDDAPGT